MGEVSLAVTSLIFEASLAILWYICEVFVDVVYFVGEVSLAVASLIFEVSLAILWHICEVFVDVV